MKNAAAKFNRTTSEGTGRTIRTAGLLRLSAVSRRLAWLSTASAWLSTVSAWLSTASAWLSTWLSTVSATWVRPQATRSSQIGYAVSH
jgi:hypothetical protein